MPIAMVLTRNVRGFCSWVDGFPSRCLACGTLSGRRLSRGERVFRCVSCSTEQDRDVDAARNILVAGLRAGQLGGDIPACWKEEEQRSVRSVTTGALRFGTEQYRDDPRAV